jgi:endonuclease/exonuclease/phosphatase family metal-dependent hydrolase
MSFNVRQSKAKEVDPNNSWTNRKDACLTMLRETMPDVVGFQEVQMGDQWPFFRDSLRASYDGYAIGRRDGKVKGETSGFLYNRTKLTLLEHGTFWLSETPEQPSLSFDEKYYRSATWGIFKVARSNKCFLYINTHMGLTYKSQTQGFKVILEKLPQLNPDGYPVVITGDFNVPVNHDAFAQARETMNNALDVAKQKVNADAPTFNAWGNESKYVIIDHIWLSRDIRCLVYVTDNKAYDGHQFISDHYPVIAELKF